MPRWSQWSLAARSLYIAGLVLGAGSIATSFAMGSVGWPPMIITGAVIFFAASAVADLFPIKLHDFEFTMSSVPRIAAILIFPPPVPVLIAGLSSLASDATRRPIRNTAWNGATACSTVLVSSAVYRWLSAGSAFTSETWIQLPAILGMAFTYYAINALSVALLLSLVFKRNVAHILRANLTTVYLDLPGSVMFGILVAFIWHDRPYLAIIIGGLGVVVYRAYDYAHRLRRETVEALETVADIVDARDPYTYNHSLLVAELSRMLAERLGCGPADVDTIVLAAYLHDIGKIGIPDRLLHKDARLTDEEYEKLKEHPALGARILERYSQFHRGSEIVLAHQEKYDGTGYPRGLRGEDIPLGARMIAVVDSYVAMTTDRPYRAALSVEEACRRLTQGIGTQFDPVVCGTFIKLLEEKRLDQVDNVVEMNQLREARQAARG